MRQRRLAAVLAILALLLQALVPLGPAHAERAVICGADGPVTVLIDLASGRPIDPAPPTKEHGCCLVGAHCGSCASMCTHGTDLARAATAPAAQPARATPVFARHRQTPVRARAPPSTSQL